VDDLVGGMLAMAATPDDVTGPINLGNPSEFTIRQLAEMVIELTNSKSRIVERPLPQDDPRQRRPDIAKAIEHLGWKPKIQLSLGLKKTIAYFDALLAQGDSGRDSAKTRGRAA
jgi:UDP-glucuronate decarboxylase